MEYKLSFNAYVSNGTLHIRNRKHFDEQIKTFEGKDLEVVVQKKRSYRSIEQNKFWWAIMTIVGKEIGMYKDELHEVCKYKFLKREKVMPNGEVMEYLGSTTELTKSEFSELVERLTIWAGELGIRIPTPNEQLNLLT